MAGHATIKSKNKIELAYMQYVRYITIFMARSGSKFLRSLLLNHPLIKDFGEIFHNRDERYPDGESIRSQLINICLQRSTTGFQLRFPRHFVEFPELISLIENNSKTFKVIFLSRQNKLKGAISQQVTEQIQRNSHGTSHVLKDPDFFKRGFFLDIQRAIAESLEREINDKKWLSWSKLHFDTCHATYEDIVTHSCGIIRQLYRFLNVPICDENFSPKTHLQKITPDNLQEAIANYDELVLAVKQIGRLEWLSETPLNDCPILTISKADIQSQAEQNSIFEVSQKEPDNTFSNHLLFSKDTKIKKRLKSHIIIDEKVDGSDKHVKLEAFSFNFKTHARFLEHTASVNRPNDVGELLVTQDEDIFISSDLGVFWNSIPIGTPIPFCFTLHNGYRLLRGADTSLILVDRNWAHISSSKISSYFWHGSWGIDQNPLSGTIMWGEYPAMSQKVRLWRSIDNGASWSISLELNGALSQQTDSIRHFHTCQHSTTNPGVWYLSSGDTNMQTNLWISNDDGLHWEKVPILSIKGNCSDIPSEHYSSLFRYTSLVQTDDCLIFPTDDTIKKRGARVVAISKNDLNNPYIFDGNCGPNEMRNIISIDQNFALAFSESKRDSTHIHLCLIDINQKKVFPLNPIENASQKKSNVMNSLSSKSARSGSFFSFNDNIALRPTGKILAWKCQIETFHKS